MGQDSTGFKLHHLDEFRYSEDMVVKVQPCLGVWAGYRIHAEIVVTSESHLEVWADNRHPAHTTAIGQHFRTITRSGRHVSSSYRLTFAERRLASTRI